MAEQSSISLTPLERPFWERVFESTYVALLARLHETPLKGALDSADSVVVQLRKRYKHDNSEVLRRSTCPRCHHSYDVR